MLCPRGIEARASIIVILVSGIVGVNCIFGGSDAEEGEFPWQVSVQAYAQHICGGTIISKRHILTAAHCFDGITEPPFSEITVVTGTRTLEPGNGHAYRVRNIVLHNQYVSRTDFTPVKNDIAVVSLTPKLLHSTPLRKEIVDDSYESVIALPTEEVTGNVSGIVSGFGRTNSHGKLSTILQKLTVKIGGRNQCMDLGVRIQKNQMCVFHDNGSGTTKGDSGGPLVHNGVVVGVSSTAPIRWGIGIPCIYTRVFYNNDFIRQAIATT